jgi:Cu(I)/Ag(I) efflux system membrane protein CusA/SilA
VIVMRSGKNALETIAAVKAKLASLQASLPQGRGDRADLRPLQLIERAVENLATSCSRSSSSSRWSALVFLFHLRSALVAIVTLPLGILAALHRHALPGRQRQHHVAGRHRHRHRRDGRRGGGDDRERAQAPGGLAARAPGRAAEGEERWRVIGEAAAEVGPALFFSLLIITLSSCRCSRWRRRRGGCSRRWPSPRPMRWPPAAGLSVTLIPVLMGYLIRGRIPDEQRNPLNRALIALYRPLLDGCCAGPRRRWWSPPAAGEHLWPLQRLGGEFMPPLDEGDLLYMPSALPGLSASKAPSCCSRPTA